MDDHQGNKHADKKDDAKGNGNDQSNSNNSES
jgi:hypothetical protein